LRGLRVDRLKGGGLKVGGLRVEEGLLLLLLLLLLALSSVPW